MNTAEAIIAVHSHRLDYLALAIASEGWASLDLAFDSADLCDADVLVEGEIVIPLGLLVELRDACGVYALMCGAKADQIIVWILLLNLELRQDEGKFGELGLALVLD